MSTTFSNSLGLGDSSSYLANGPGLSLSFSLSLANVVGISIGGVGRVGSSIAGNSWDSCAHNRGSGNSQATVGCVGEGGEAKTTLSSSPRLGDEVMASEGRVYRASNSC